MLSKTAMGKKLCVTKPTEGLNCQYGAESTAYASSSQDGLLNSLEFFKWESIAALLTNILQLSCMEKHFLTNEPYVVFEIFTLGEVGEV